jgi:hypothetical protein
MLLRVGDFEVRVLGLPSIIESMAVVDREKGRAMLGALRRTLEEKKREAVA